jgi:hypothetical protein
MGVSVLQGFLLRCVGEGGERTLVDLSAVHALEWRAAGSETRALTLLGPQDVTIIVRESEMDSIEQAWARLRKGALMSGAE